MSTFDLMSQAVENYKDTILSAERHIWHHPESGYREWKTHAYMKEQFESLGYTITEAGNIPGFYTDVETGTPGPKLAIFAEMDSLIVPTHPESDPDTGAVHACGHHAQCAAMLGIAAALKAPGALGNLSGSIRLIVVPAEEGIEIEYRRQLMEQGVIRYISGKLEFMHRGILDGVDLAMMVHTSAANGIGCARGSNGCIVKEAIFHGKSAHAGGSPHAGINALYAANTALQAANALRETFREVDTIRFHPIITSGGSAVNAIPDRVTIESYLRGATMSAIQKENEKVNRAFAGAAVSMGCGLTLRDIHGYAPRFYPADFKQVFRDVASLLVSEDQLNFNENWGTGCSDMGDVSCVMPAIHPTAGGAVGTGHGSDYYISDPYLACVVSAKLQVGVIDRLLCNDAEKAKSIVAAYQPEYASIQEYLQAVDQMNFDGDAVTYQNDGTIRIRYK